MPKKSAQPLGAKVIQQAHIPDVLKDGLPLPTLLVFDLDYTLWPFWVDTHVTPPLKVKDGGSKAVDRYGEGFSFYRDVPQILATIKSLPNGPLIASASRTHAPDLAATLLKQLTVPTRPWEPAKTSFKAANTYFDQHQIFPGDKKTHMTKLKDKLAVPFEEMLFFDDELRNNNVEKLGVTFWLVRDGVTWTEIGRGIKAWRKRNGRESREE